MSITADDLQSSIYSSAQTIAGEDFFIVEFSENILLSTRDDSYPHHVEPTLAISDNDTIFAGWKNAFSHNGGGVRVSFSKSVNNGVNWTTPFDMPMFNGSSRQSDPWLVWNEGVLYYAYLEFSQLFSQTTVSRTGDYGVTWSSAKASNGTGFADKETMTIDKDGRIYVAYDDVGSIPFTPVRLTRSTDNGNTFQETAVITTLMSDHVGPYVTTDSNGDVYVAWTILNAPNYTWGDIHIAVSKNKGESFSLNTDINPGSENATFTVTTEGLPRRVTLPVIRFDQNDRLYVLWAERFEDGGTWDVYLRYSDDYSLTWSPRYQVNPETGGDQWQPDMDIDSKGCLHVVYYDQQESSFRPYYRTVVVPETTDAEPIFGDPIPVATVYTYRTFTRPGDYFTVRVDSNDIPHVVWTDGRHNEMDIYYSHGIPKEISTSFGIAWLLIPLVLVLLGLGYNYRKKRLKV